MLRNLWCFSLTLNGFYCHFLRSLTRRVQSTMAAVRMKTVLTRSLCSSFLLLFLASSLLCLCGDVELNPGPSGTKSKSTSKASTPSTSRQQSNADSSFSPKSDNSASKSDAPISLEDVFSLLQVMQKDMADLKCAQAKLSQQVTDILSENAKLIEENKALNCRVTNLERKVDDLEARSKRNNLLFYGLPETREEKTPDDCERVLKAFLKDKLGVSDVSFDRVHRLRSRQTPQPIIARFTFFKERQKVLQEKKKLQGTSHFIGEDFPASIRDIRQKLKPTLTDARKNNKRATMVFDHLIIDGQRWDFDPVTQSVKPRERQQRGERGE